MCVCVKAKKLFCFFFFLIFASDPKNFLTQKKWPYFLTVIFILRKGEREGGRKGRKEEINSVCIPKESEKAERQHALFWARRLITICVVFVAVSLVGITLGCVNCSRDPTVQRISKGASVAVNKKPTRIWILDLMFCLFFSPGHSALFPFVLFYFKAVHSLINVRARIAKYIV